MRGARLVVVSFMVAAFGLPVRSNPAQAQAPATAAATTHRVVFQLSSEVPAAWEGLVGNVETLRTIFGPGPAAFEIVAHGPGIGFLLGKNTALASRMEALAKAGVSFVACENTMKRKNIERTALLPFVTTVPAGVAEVVLKQEAGWAYIKAGL